MSRPGEGQSSELSGPGGKLACQLANSWQQLADKDLHQPTSSPSRSGCYSLEEREEDVGRRLEEEIRSQEKELRRQEQEVLIVEENGGGKVVNEGGRHGGRITRECVVQPIVAGLLPTLGNQVDEEAQKRNFSQVARSHPRGLHTPPGGRSGRVGELSPSSRPPMTSIDD